MDVPDLITTPMGSRVIVSEEDNDAAHITAISNALIDLREWR